MSEVNTYSLMATGEEKNPAQIGQKLIKFRKLIDTVQAQQSIGWSH